MAGTKISSKNGVRTANRGISDNSLRTEHGMVSETLDIRTYFEDQML